jgi:hypothetical protein
LKNIFGTSWDFYKFAEKFSKHFATSTPWNELAAPRTIKIIENGP